MSFFKRRKKRQEQDRAYERAARVPRNDTIGKRFAGGNTYTPADIEMLERERLAYWRRRKRT